MPDSQTSDIYRPYIAYTSELTVRWPTVNDVSASSVISSP